MQRTPKKLYMNKEFRKQATQDDQPTLLFGHLVVLIDCASSLTLDSVQCCIAQMQCDWKELPVIGFDAEWKPVFKKGVKPRLALLQMASRHACLLVKLHPDCRESDAPVLDALFGSGGLFSRSDLIACGVGVFNDTKMLKQQLGIDAFSRICDVGELAVEWGISMKSSLNSAFLAALCKPMNKSKKVTMSNWEKEPLSAAQVQYASDDAVAGLAIMASVFQNRILLASHKGWPTPPLLTISATDLHAMQAPSDEVWNFVNIMKVGMQGIKNGSIEVLLNTLQITGGYLVAKNGGLVTAATYGHFECLRAILSCIAIMDINACTQDGLAIQTAVKHNRLDCLQILVTAGVDINTRMQKVSNISALQLAVKMGRTECVQVLLTARADVNAVSKGGVTALYLCKFTKTSCISFMLFTAGANINSCETVHRDALIQDEYRTFISMEQQYLRQNKYSGGNRSLQTVRGHDDNFKNEVFSDLTQQEQISPRTQKIFGSIRIRNVEKFEAIVANTSDINCCNIGKKGDTVLIAILRNHRLKKRLIDGDEIEISKIQILIKYGASWITKNKLGETAEDLLKSYDSNVIARIKTGLLEETQSSSVDLPASIESKAIFKSYFPLSPVPSDDDFASLSSSVIFSSKAQKIFNISVMKKANVDSLTLFLNYISFGQQDQAEDMLCQNHDLALLSGDLLDCANRQFTQITALQYAIWALDWGMLDMLKRYLSEEAIRKQITESERGTWIKEYGSFVSWQKLIDALQRYIDNHNIWTDLECQEHWIKNVGGEQLMLPAHVIQEYCRSDKTQKSAEPVFLSRIDITINKNWFENNKGEKLGIYFGRIRGYMGKKDGKCRSIPVRDIKFNEHWINMIKHDIKLLERLLKIRLQQCTNFISNIYHEEIYEFPKTNNIPVANVAQTAKIQLKTNDDPINSVSSLCQTPSNGSQNINETPKLNGGLAMFFEMHPEMRPGSSKSILPKKQLDKPLLFSSANKTPSAPDVVHHHIHTIETGQAQLKQIEVTSRASSSHPLLLNNPVLFPSHKMNTGSIEANLENLTKFLKHIGFGEQDEAEAMLKADPKLAELPGDLIDCAKREFKQITGFQYAVWALDWHMWKMLQKYISPEAIKVQIESLNIGAWVSNHGTQVSWQSLIDALQMYIKNYSSTEQCRAHWCQQVKIAQLSLPAHVINEYSRMDRSFRPCPVFNETYLPRSGSDKWRYCQSTTWVRGAGEYVRERGYGCGVTGKIRKWWKLDHAALSALSTIRMEQRIQLISKYILFNRSSVTPRAVMS